MHYVYVLGSLKDNGFYIGYSANLRKRFSEHLTGGSFATSHRGPWQLIYYEAYLKQADALGRERYLQEWCGKALPQSSAKALPLPLPPTFYAKAAQLKARGEALRDNARAESARNGSEESAGLIIEENANAQRTTRPTPNAKPCSRDRPSGHDVCGHTRTRSVITPARARWRCARVCPS